MQMIKECLICWKEFPTFPSTIKIGKGKYCSLFCRGISQRTFLMKKCLACGKEFKIIPSKNKRRYCSLKCYWIFEKGKNHSNWKGDNVGKRGLHKWVEIKLGKPKKCQDCGTTNAKRYEWANISGEYHRDIKDFKRLCYHCHRKFDNHLHPRGEKHYFAKLTEKDVFKIRHLYIPYKYTQSRLSKEFKVHQMSISSIVNRVSWKHI